MQLINPEKYIEALSSLTLSPDPSSAAAFVRGLGASERSELLRLAEAHHVTVRALSRFLELSAGNCSEEQLQWASSVISVEQGRISVAIDRLRAIAEAFDREGYPLVVIKTLDHWPDFGNDIDLYTTADERRVCDLLLERFGATPVIRSWGDHLAHKWSFNIPGMIPQVEIHVKRLGQAGEHVELARRFVSRATKFTVNGTSFCVPAPEERIIAATLQRMYRHLYVRICDVANTAALVQSKAVNYEQLRAAAELGGIWNGVATFLVLTSEYFQKYSGTALPLTDQINGCCLFHSDKMFVKDKYVHLPVLPEGLALFRRQWAQAARRHDVPATLRLSMVPALASAAALSFAVFGSTERIW